MLLGTRAVLLPRRHGWGAQALESQRGTRDMEEQPSESPRSRLPSGVAGTGAADAPGMPLGLLGIAQARRKASGGTSAPCGNKNALARFWWRW